MKALEIYRNGRLIVTAAMIGKAGILTSIVTWIGDDSRPDAGLHFHVGGADGETGENLDWPVPAIAEGDEITIKLVEAVATAPEPLRYRFDRAAFEAERERWSRDEGD